ncbi:MULTISPECIES: mechanosensitive ion channel family protein [Marinomonas]|uniref:Mechanosensitive ion channel-like protein n=1 Tax=Marinomonas alcarazii TaxID=491949 RepID=A0A318V3L7_9GAMM|nr:MULTISPECIES: mechanosensitive ion channel domain-containing protein [Marinomonas]PYF83184.1 mechanosensitive ion channel-like protein [Marinomonas alcarazii]
MVNIEQIKGMLSYEFFSIAGHSMTVGGVLLIPAMALVGFWATKYLVRFLTTKLTKRNADPNIIHLVRRLLYAIAISIIVITVLDIINVPITAFAFLSGAIAIGFGFGAQNIINNFISGWILMWEKPIRIGDFLEVENAKGVVEEINTRSTRFRRTDGVHMLIPNSKLLENTIVNWTLVDKLMRTSVKIGVAYGSPAKKVAELILQAVEEQDGVLNNPPPQVIFEDFGDNALIFEVNFWIQSNVEGGLRMAKSNVRFRLDELLADNEIVIAYPQRDVHIDGSLKLLKSEA